MTEKKPSLYDKTVRICTHLWIFSLIFSVVAAEALAVLLFLLWLPTLRRRPRLWTPIDLPVLIFLAVRLLSIATSIDPITSLQALRKIPFLLVFFPLSRLAWNDRAKGVSSFLRTLVLAGVVVSAYGLIQVTLVEVYRLHSTTSGPATLAMFLSTTFVVGVALAVGGILKPVLPWLLGLIGMLWAMAFTYGRAAWFAAVIVGLGLVSRWRRWVFALVVMAAAIVLLVPGFRVRNAEVLQWPPNVGDRLVIWQAGWERIEERPLLGHGPNTFDLLFDRRPELHDKGAGAWHNVVLQLLLESGIVGVLAFAWVLLEAIQLGRSGRRQGDDPAARPVATALLAGISVLLLSGLFGNLIGDPVIDLLFWGLVGFLAAFVATGAQGATTEAADLREDPPRQ